MQANVVYTANKVDRFLSLLIRVALKVLFYMQCKWHIYMYHSAP